MKLKKEDRADFKKTIGPPKGERAPSLGLNVATWDAAVHCLGKRTKHRTCHLDIEKTSQLFKLQGFLPVPKAAKPGLGQGAIGGQHLPHKPERTLGAAGSAGARTGA